MFNKWTTYLPMMQSYTHTHIHIFEYICWTMNLTSSVKTRHVDLKVEIHVHVLSKFNGIPVNFILMPGSWCICTLQCRADSLDICVLQLFLGVKVELYLSFCISLGDQFTKVKFKRFLCCISILPSIFSSLTSKAWNEWNTQSTTIGEQSLKASCSVAWRSRLLMLMLALQAELTAMCFVLR